MQKLDREQMILMQLADMLIEVFAAESSILRVQKMASVRGEEAVSLYADMVQTYVASKKLLATAVELPFLPSLMPLILKP